MRTKIFNKISTPVLAFLTLILFSATTIKAAPGDLDLSFGNGGKVVTSISNAPYFEEPHSLLVQSDGKILVCGQIFESDIDGDRYVVSFFIARYHPNGTLDNSFGSNGKVVPTNPSLTSGYVGIDCALQPDGEIVSVGYGSSGIPNGGFAFAVHRYNANGSLDALFGTGGVVLTPVGTGFSRAESVLIQPDGKIVVVGNSQPNPNSFNFTVIRLHPNGSLDSSFGTDGKVITSFGDGSSAFAAVLQPNGKIVAVGYAEIIDSLTSFALARYNSDGSLDSDFGNQGKVIHDVTFRDVFHDVALQPDGKIVAAGFGSNVTTLVRYTSSGSVDSSFAKNGIFTTEGSFENIAMQPNGKILGFGSPDRDSRFAVLRLNPSGAPDTSFGTNGKVFTPPIIINQVSWAVDGAIQPDGKILAFGLTFLNTGDNEIAIVRYLGDSVVPRSAQFDFDGDRRADVSVFRPSDRVWYLNQSANGFSARQFGLSTDKITPADFDGDGKTDIAVYRDGIWYLLRSTLGFAAIQFGLADDVPVPADFTGDGRAELAVYRSGVWWTLDLTNYQASAIQFGISTDKPVAADYDGDGRADQAVYRDGEWHLNRSSQGYTVINFGLATDKPVVGDYDGDGKTDQAVYRDGVWYLLQSSNGFAAFQFGLSTDTPAPADYDGDGKTDAAVFRDGVWYLRQSTNGFAAQQFGLTNDKPVPAAFLP